MQKKLWELAQNMGVSYMGEEEDMVNHMKHMEERDQKEIEQVKKKKKGGARDGCL